MGINMELLWPAIYDILYVQAKYIVPNLHLVHSWIWTSMFKNKLYIFRYFERGC